MSAARDKTREALLGLLGAELAGRTIAGTTLLDRLLDAVARGRLEIGGDGRLSLPAPVGSRTLPWISHVPDTPSPEGDRDHCRSHFFFLFDAVYGKAALPFGCRRCHKVRVQVDSLAALVELRELTKQMPCVSKCGSELDSPYSPGIWSAYLYADGLDAAYEIHTRIRALIDANPRLRNAAKTTIKRGCTEYEMALGPSDRWQVDDTLAELEARLLPLFAPPAGTKTDDRATYLGWIATAHRIGDDSYLELTGGRPLYPAPVDYLERADPPPPGTADT